MTDLGPLPLIRPRWAEDGSVPGVGAVMSTRGGGVSTGAFASLNLGRAVGDDADAVAENRRRFEAAIGARIVWMRQVHGTNVLRLDAGTRAHPDEPADAAWTAERGIACTVGAADCLPVLLAADDGRAVAAAHAGWRGLAAGVLEATVRALTAGSGVAPHRVVAWLGPCIGPRAFEVGADVLEAFGRARLVAAGASDDRFVWSPRADGSPRWRADLPALAADRLRALGLGRIEASGRCTVEEPSAFFSFRRDGAGGGSGRMAAAIWRR